LTSLSFNFDVLPKELLKSGRVKNSILGWFGDIDGVLYSRTFGSGDSGLEKTQCKPTEKGAQQSDAEYD